MIQTIATQMPGQLFDLATTEKVNGKLQHVTGANLVRSMRLHYFWTRLYILEKLIAYCRQRMKAFELTGLTGEHNIASSLFKVLINYRSTSLQELSRIVCFYEKYFVQIAPPEHSSQYRFYDNTVKSILQYCREQIGDVQ